MKKKWAILGILIASLSLVGTALARPQAHIINWWVIGGGGGSGASGGTALDGTVGQWAVGSGTSGSTHLESGFWVSGSAAGPADEQVFLPLILRQHP